MSGAARGSKISYRIQVVYGGWRCMMVYGGEMVYERWKVVYGGWRCMIRWCMVVVYEV